VRAALQSVVDQRLVDAGASIENRTRNLIGVGYAAGTLVEFADLEVQDRLLRPTFTAEEVWCQLFSEPGAGSDLAGLSTSAALDGDVWRIRGQKVWTSFAHVARWGLLLARTDPDVQKHRGLTGFVVDMQAPGVDVRPLFEMTGDAEFNEVFLDDVRVPDAHRLGAVGDGWRVAISTLKNERVAAGGPTLIDHAVRAWRSSDHDPARLDRLMQLWSAAEVLRLTTERAAIGDDPRLNGSLLKLQWAELNKAIMELTLALQGARGMLYDDGYTFRRPAVTEVSSESSPKAFLRCRANSIEGGTSEIMRNVLAERVLGLPDAGREDRDMPWRDVPRS
jgi:alkylation response protein AidB-like acyl-CoA dehydrogenase